MNPTELYQGSVSRLALLFHDSMDQLGTFEPVQAEDLPADARKLLAHNEHMTVTLESFHNGPVDVNVVAKIDEGSTYSREILLSRHSDDAVVQFGIMRIWLDGLPEETRDEIRQQKSPLGRVLIQQGLLRDVELMTLWRIKPSSFMAFHLDVDENATVHGRTAQILVDGRPTVQLLEIVNC